MLKMLGWVVAVLFSGLFTYQSLNKEGEELDYVMDSMSFLVPWNINQDYLIACHQEGSNHSSGDTLDVHQIGRLVDKGLMACVIDGRVGIPLGVGRALTEAAYIPVKATIPYELAKRVLESDKVMRCSDYIKPLILNCPKTLRPYLKRVEFIKAE